MIREPKVISEGYAYIDEQTEEWTLKKDAPEWAVNEFHAFFKQVNQEFDDTTGTITKY